MMGFQRLCFLAVLLSLLVSTQAYTSRMEDRGYNADPYARDDVNGRDDIPTEYYDEVDTRANLTDPSSGVDSRMEGREYSSGPVEDNVSGVDCMLQGNSFGEIDGTIDPEPIEFNYQLETIPDEQAGEEAMLDDLEKAILDKVLSTLFADLCGSRRRQLQRRLAIVGASTYPVDEDLGGESVILFE